MSIANAITVDPMNRDDDQIPLQRLRAQIDEIDQQLVQLLSERMAIVDTVSQQKVQSGIVFRPRREQQKHAALQQMARQNGLAPDMVFALWRVLMTQASYRQRPFSLSVGNAQIIPWVQHYFVAFTDTEPNYGLSGSNSQAIMDQQAETDRRMSVISYQGGDWPITLINSSAHITTALPWWYSSQTSPEAYVIADAPWDLEADAEWVLWYPGTLVTQHALVYPPLACADGYVIHVPDTNAHDSVPAMQTAFIRQFGDQAKLLGRIPRPAPLG